MPEDNGSFSSLIQRIQSGDEAAAAELVRLYEPAIRRTVRMQLTDPHLRRVFDSVDVCQSVLANFFVRTAAGQFELHSPQQLLALLARMARNKVLDYARRQQAERRDQRRIEGGAEALNNVADKQEPPSENVAGRELLQRLRASLTEQELYLMDQRHLGREWTDLAAELGAQPDQLRMQLTRALDRAASQLGFDEVSDE